MFDAALAEDVDFVLLTGNLCDPHRAGPRGFVFLHDQFARLAERGIAVYWTTGPTDGRSDWPAKIEWPAGVHVFASNCVEHRTHHRDGKPVCQIAGRSIDDATPAAQLSAAAFAPSPDGLFSIAIVPTPLLFEMEDLAAIGNNYWAIGGSPQAATTLAEFEPPCVVHCAGTPQGRKSCGAAQNCGPFGCTLVHVDINAIASDEDQIRLTPIATDVVRWHEERIVCPELFEAADFERHLRERMSSLIAASADRTLLIRWQIERSESAAGSFDPSNSCIELLSMLRTEYGFGETPAWSVSLAMAPLKLPASWSEQQTLLGEFLRHLQEYELVDADGPELGCYLSQPQLAGPLGERVSFVDPTTRASVLRKAAVLGAELLSSGTALRQTATHGDSTQAKGAGSR